MSTCDCPHGSCTRCDTDLQYYPCYDCGDRVLRFYSHGVKSALGRVKYVCKECYEKRRKEELS